MPVQIDNDKNIENDQTLADRVRTVVEKTLELHTDRLGPVEVHLGDMNARPRLHHGGPTSVHAAHAIHSCR